MLSGRLDAVDRWMADTNAQLRELTRQVAITNGNIKTNIFRLDGHDREFKQMRDYFDSARETLGEKIDAAITQLSAGSGDNRGLTWRDAKLIAGAASAGGGVIWGAVKGVEWLVHALKAAS